MPVVVAILLLALVFACNLAFHQAVSANEQLPPED